MTTVTNMIQYDFPCQLASRVRRGRISWDSIYQDFTHILSHDFLQTQSDFDFICKLVSDPSGFYLELTNTLNNQVTCFQRRFITSNQVRTALFGILCALEHVDPSSSVKFIIQNGNVVKMFNEFVCRYVSMNWVIPGKKNKKKNMDLIVNILRFQNVKFCFEEGEVFEDRFGVRLGLRKNDQSNQYYDLGVDNTEKETQEEEKQEQQKEEKQDEQKEQVAEQQIELEKAKEIQKETEEIKGTEYEPQNERQNEPEIETAQAEPAQTEIQKQVILEENKSPQQKQNQPELQSQITVQEPIEKPQLISKKPITKKPQKQRESAEATQIIKNIQKIVPEKQPQIIQNDENIENMISSHIKMAEKIDELLLFKLQQEKEQEKEENLFKPKENDQKEQKEEKVLKVAEEKLDVRSMSSWQLKMLKKQRKYLKEENEEEQKTALPALENVNVQKEQPKQEVIQDETQPINQKVEQSLESKPLQNNSAKFLKEQNNNTKTPVKQSMLQMIKEIELQNMQSAVVIPCQKESSLKIVLPESIEQNISVNLVSPVLQVESVLINKQNKTVQEPVLTKQFNFQNLNYDQIKLVKRVFLEMDVQFAIVQNK
ncbi:Conserved_hypothetical protein [Hexamita inflata]|uniref:non-specific serine/threonine protein kinase n=1 Tax=Hexamita inflata TaxID=28002 RepID=A0AA86Q3X7_9EUKA|nr:Conserved hypothetical protein [Hexamita inflata]